MSETPSETSGLGRVLVVADPLHAFAIYKDTTFAIMRELSRRGTVLAACEPAHLQWRSGEAVTALVREIELTDDPRDWFVVRRQGREPLRAFDAVLMRKDPPFDAEYFYATHLLQQAQREGARVFNDPAALRDHPEKLALMAFAQWAPPTLVTRSAEAIRAFHAEHRDIILKPLDGMGGRGVFRVGADGMNLGAIVETLTQHGHTTIMAQRFLPQIADGDKRILIIGGEAAPYALARIPQGGEVRGNLAVGGRGEARPLT
ncbi:MAG: glutathione synthase, partial [Tepidimonas sp.]|uniref:glutathione synthase n=1 Tax=Tepidimonas sp. TaxID=2002775 RepID=UPI0040550056